MEDFDYIDADEGYRKDDWAEMDRAANEAAMNEVEENDDEE